MTNTEALTLAAELEGFAEGSTSARATLMRDAAATIRALIPEPPRPHDPSDDWYCGKCHGSAYEHSLESSTCIWEPVAVVRPEPPTDDEREDEFNRILDVLRFELRTSEKNAERTAYALMASSPLWRNRRRGPITDEKKSRLVEDILTYGHIEGLSLRGYVQAAVRMTLEADEAAR